MRTKTPLSRLRLIALTLLLTLALLLSACGKKPEDSLAKHLDAMSEIMEKNMDKPADGIDKLRSYLHDNLPDMAEQVGKMVVELEKMDKEADIKARAEEMNKSLKESGDKFEKQMKSFGEKAFSDADAQKKMAEIQKSWEPVMMMAGMAAMMMGGGGMGPSLD
jgi:TolA-binding protein